MFGLSAHPARMAGEPTLVADGAERRHRGLAHQRIVSVGGQVARARVDARRRRSSPAHRRPRPPLRPPRRSSSWSALRAAETAGPGAGDQHCPPAHAVMRDRSSRVAGRRRSSAPIRSSAPRASSRAAGSASASPPRARGLVALMAGHLPGARQDGVRRGHFFSMLVSVMTTQAMPKPRAVASDGAHPHGQHAARGDRPQPPPPASAGGQRRRHAADLHARRRASRGRRARAGSAVALAVLRQPVAIRATMARPAIHAAAVVTSVILTQSDMVTDPAASPSARPTRGHRWWAVPMAVVGFLWPWDGARAQPRARRSSSSTRTDAGSSTRPTRSA